MKGFCWQQFCCKVEILICINDPGFPIIDLNFSSWGWDWCEEKSVQFSTWCAAVDQRYGVWCSSCCFGVIAPFPWYAVATLERWVGLAMVMGWWDRFLYFCVIFGCIIAVRKYPALSLFSIFIVPTLCFKLKHNIQRGLRWNSDRSRRSHKSKPWSLITNRLSFHGGLSKTVGDFKDSVKIHTCLKCVASIKGIYGGIGHMHMHAIQKEPQGKETLWVCSSDQATSSLK